MKYLPCIALSLTLGLMICSHMPSQAQYVSGGIVSTVNDFSTSPATIVSDSHNFLSNSSPTWLVPFEVDSNASLGTGRTATGMAKGSMGTLHAKTSAAYTASGDSSYSETHASINVLDYAIATQQILGQTAVAINVSLDMSGTHSSPDIEFGGAFAAVASAGYSISDGVNQLSLSYNSHQNSPLNQSAIFNTVAGRTLTIQYNLDLESYVNGVAAQRQAVVDFSNTMHVFMDAVNNGGGLTSNSGFDYSSPAPEPGFSALAFGAGIASLFGIRRRVRVK